MPENQHPLEAAFLLFDEQVKRAMKTVETQFHDAKGVPQPQEGRRRTPRPAPVNPLAVNPLMEV